MKPKATINKISASQPHKTAEAPTVYRAQNTKPGSTTKRISISKTKIAAFCRRWKISEFSLFGSVLREDFRPDSDVDVLVSFQQQTAWSLWDLVEMQEELEKMFAHKVDLLEKEAIRNPYRRRSILNGREVFYASK